MSEEPPQRPTSGDDRENRRAYWAALGMPWRTEPEVDEARQRYLAERRAVRPNIQLGVYPFRDEHGPVTLTRADVEWLLATHDAGRGPVALHEIGHRPGVDLRGSNLRKVDLGGLPLTAVRFGLMPSERRGATPNERELAAAHLQRTGLSKAHIEAGHFYHVHLERADLREAYLAGANMEAAHLDAANLFRAHLEGQQVPGEPPHGRRAATPHTVTYLPPADLRRVFFSMETNLHDAVLGSKEYGGVALADVRWSGVNLAVADWTAVSKLGDEYQTTQRSQEAATRWGPGLSRAKRRQLRHRQRRQQFESFQASVRAYRQLAAALRTQGMNEDADRFTYRAQLCQRVILRRQGIRKWPAYLGLLLLWLLAGYGYRIWRIFVAYALVLLVFATAYFLLGIPNEPTGDLQSHLLNALLVSLTSIHGRVFFEQFGFTPQAWVAAVESVVGIVIEGVFVAMLIQRWFQR